MAKINIPFNGTNYPVDESALATAKSNLRSHLSTVMNGTGAVIKLGGNTYNVDSTKLTTATNVFISHLGTVAGSGTKVKVNGVEYSIDSTKMSNAITKLHTVLGGMMSGGGSDSDILPAGLYDANGVMITSWEDLLANGTVLVDNGVVSQGDNSDALSGTLTLPNDGSITSIGDGAFFGCSELVGAIIPDSVTSIGNTAFRMCTSLESIEIPERVTSIGNYTFGNCSSLASVTIPESVESIGDYAFSDCTSLESITIPDSVTRIGNNAFYACRSLTNITIPDGVTNISQGTFYLCSNLESVTIPASVTSIGKNAFGLCSNLTYMTFEGTMAQWDAIEKYLYWSSGVSITYVQCTDGQALFDNTPSAGLYNNSGVMTASWGELLTNGVIHMDNGIIVSNYDSSTRKNTSSEVLSGTLVLPKDGSVMSIGKNAFRSCTKLVSIHIPDSVTSIGQTAFSSCSTLVSATFDNPIGWYVTKTEGATSGTDVTLPLESQNAKYLKTTYASYYWYRTTTNNAELTILDEAILENTILD